MLAGPGFLSGRSNFARNKGFLLHLVDVTLIRVSIDISDEFNDSIVRYDLHTLCLSCQSHVAN